MNRPAPLMTINDMAAAMQLPEKTLYAHIARLVKSHPDIEWFVKIGRARRFKDAHYNKI